MTNVLPFTSHRPKLKLDKQVVDPSLTENTEVRVVWKSILGISGEEINYFKMINSIKLADYVKETREKFKSSYNNIKKFPKMDESDWE